MKKNNVPESLVPYLKEMIMELEAYEFKACQIEDYLSSKNKWVSGSKNPEWYSLLIRKYPKLRKKWAWKKKASKKLRLADSIIKKVNIKEILVHLSKNRYSKSKYAPDLIQIAETRAKNQDAITEVEFIFYEFFHILLKSNKQIVALSKIPKELWLEIADYYKKKGVFPDWIFLDQIESAPF